MGFSRTAGGHIATGAFLGHRCFNVDRQFDVVSPQLAFDRMWVRLIMIPYQFLYPGILVFCAIGVLV
jgi:hypothetical protein